MIDLSPEYLSTVKDILQQLVPEYEVRVFGSRYKWLATTSSDLDLAVVGTEQLSARLLSNLQDAFADSDLPFKVDVLDWQALSDEFKAVIEKGYEVIQKPSKKLPEGWTVARLGDICFYVKNKIGVDKLSIHNYISTDNMLKNCNGISVATDLPNINTVTQYGKNDILLSNIRPYFKKLWLATFDGGCSNDVLVLRITDNNITDGNWLYYHLMKDEFFDYVMSGAKGTKMPRGDKNHILNYQLIQPSLPQQKSIAAILSSLDNLIELNTKMNKKLEEIAQAIFKQWFIDFNFPDENGNPYKDSGGEMVDSEMGLIPKGWRLYKLKDLSLFVKGKKPTELSATKYANFLPQILINYFQDGKLLFADPEGMTVSGEDDIIMVMDGASSGMVEFGVAGIIGSTLAILRTDTWLKSILYFLLKSKQKDIQDNTTGSAIPHTDKERIYKYHISLPSNQDCLYNMNNFLTNFRRKIVVNRMQLRQTANIRASLLPQLISGELPVK